MLPGMYSRRMVGAAGGGGGAPLVGVVVGDYSSYVMDPANASCGFTYGNNGNVTGVGGPGGVWKLTAAPSSDYELMVALVSGAAPSGTLGAWVNLGTAYGYTMGRTTIGENACVLQVSIRRASDGVVLNSGQVTMSAIVDA
jgi:hypothetical protein